MAKLENIIRPVVFPKIRPPARVRSTLPEGEEAENVHVIRGGSGGFIDLPFSWSINTDRSKQQEVKRRVDEVRVHQMDEEGNVDEDIWIDVHLTNKLWMRQPGQAWHQ